ncbi:5-hydroxyisourate hydrolase 2 [Candidatus Sulfopaludibacter sp. SbA3]|nr:5-hydroxyisourate hydrolase 2 [Candidatus Sulfopaludibacter sp. SbA3]
MARLSTHVLDTSRGKPAAGMQIRLYGNGELMVTAETNADGRTPEALLAGERIATGTYELIFAVGAYFRAAGEALPDPAFLDEVVVRFGIADPSGNYHVPLLVSPYGYSTYRGS